MIDILFIAFQYPPINVGGSIRPYMFSKYLPQFNIKPIVLTLDPKSQDEYIVDQNNQLINKLPPEVIIHPIPLKKKNKKFFHKFNQIYLSIGDDKNKRWKTNVLIKIEELLSQNNIKAIYFTAPPFSNGNLAVEIAKNYKIPLILDMRDGWSKWCIAPYASQLHYYFTKKREAYYFENAAEIITVTDVLKDIFSKSHPNISTSKIHVIPNGFDIANEEIPSTLSSNITTQSSEIKIGYIGTFYYNPKTEKSLNSSWWQRKPHRWFQYFPVHEKWVYRSPLFFLKALAQFIENNPSYKSKIKFVFIGKEEQWLKHMIADLMLTDNYEYRGFIEHHKLEEATKDVNYFLATSVKVKGGKDYAIASKTFDYIKFKKPILAFVTEGSQKTFVENSNTGVTFNPDNTKQNAKQFEKIFKAGISLKVNQDYLTNFTRKNIAKQLSDVISKRVIN